jgi:hypothetical protein
MGPYGNMNTDVLDYPLKREKQLFTLLSCIAPPRGIFEQNHHLISDLVQPPEVLSIVDFSCVLFNTWMHGIIRCVKSQQYHWTQSGGCKHEGRGYSAGERLWAG